MQELRLIPARKLRATPATLERAGWCGMLNEEWPLLWVQVSDWIDRNGPITNSRLREMSALDTLAASRQLRQWVGQGVLVALSAPSRQQASYTKPELADLPGSLSFPVFLSMQTWSITQHDKTWAGQAHQALLSEPFTAFFSSRQCPGAAIRAAMDWALEQARSRQAVGSGFHSPLEQSVLTVLLQARCPVVAVLARPVAGARLPQEWADPLAQGRMTVVSAATRNGGLTEGLASQRNEWVALLARQIVVAHASPGGRLAALCDGWSHAGQTLHWLG